MQPRCGATGAGTRPSIYAAAVAAAAADAAVYRQFND